MHAMDGTSSTACLISQGGRAKPGQPLPKSWASTGPPCPMFDGVQVWLEELIDTSSYQSYPSQPSSPSAPSNSPGGSRRSSECTGSLYSWSSGATCFLHSSIKKQSREAFKTRPRGERRWKKLIGCPSRGPHDGAHPEVEQGGGSNHNTLHALQERDGLGKGRGSTQTHTSNKSVKLQWLLEEKVKAKLKFSKFLDEVTSNVLHPDSLQAFGKPVCPSSFITTTPTQPEDKTQEVTQWSPGLLCSMAQQQGFLLEQKTTKEERTPLDPAQKTYLETDIDTVRRDDKPYDLVIKVETPPQLEIDEKHVIPPPPQFSQGFEMRSPFPEFHCHFPRYPYKSVSLPRGINMVSDESLPSL